MARHLLARLVEHQTPIAVVRAKLRVAMGLDLVHLVKDTRKTIQASNSFRRVNMKTKAIFQAHRLRKIYYLKTPDGTKMEQSLLGTKHRQTKVARQLLQPQEEVVATNADATRGRRMARLKPKVRLRTKARAITSI